MSSTYAKAQKRGGKSFHAEKIRENAFLDFCRGRKDREKGRYKEDERKKERGRGREKESATVR